MVQNAPSSSLGEAPHAPDVETRRLRRRLGVGLTLIELLVVIAIIEILAAFIFPVFTRARTPNHLSLEPEADRRRAVNVCAGL